MRSAPVLELADARRLVQAAWAEARSRNAIVSVAVVDGGGHPLLERADGASPASGAAALAKARMAALNNKPTAALEQAINTERPALLQLAASLGGPAAAMAGGLPLQLDGHCLGAIGVSGMTPEVDSAIAAAGCGALEIPPAVS
jgi:uncharacterized protein GlcG (DUF336 family)